MDRIGFWPWTTKVFAENFVPIFKTFWGGAILLFGGSYFAMLVLLWLTHVMTIYLYGAVLRRAGLNLQATIIAQIFFGVSSANLETLGWSVQWSSVMATTFFLVAIYMYLQLLEYSRKRPLIMLVLYGGVLVCSALSFSRGVLSGLNLAFLSLLPFLIKIEKWSSRLTLCLVSAIPSLAVAFIIFFNASGNHQHLTDVFSRKLAAILEFSAFVFLMNPLNHIGNLFHSLNIQTLIFLGLIKLSLYCYGVFTAKGLLRALFWLLVFFDLSNALLLGLGRYHTGLGASICSRYQYQPLMCLGPMLGVFLVNTVRSMFPSSRSYRPVYIVVLIGMVLLLSWRWPSEMRRWSGWRGVEPRYKLLEDPSPPPSGTVPGIPHFPTEKAKELIEKYRLH